jgi:hypothetical protein
MNRHILWPAAANHKFYAMIHNRSPWVVINFSGEDMKQTSKKPAKSAGKKAKLNKKTIKDLTSNKSVKGGAVCQGTCGDITYWPGKKGG